MIIALAGRKQSGKTTCCEYISKIFTGTKKIYNFADPLKTICMDILGLTYDQCYGTDDQKNELVDCYWHHKQLSAREVMQILGTDMFRAMQKNVWSDATIRQIIKDHYDLALIADCRFPNEVEAVKQAGGIVIKLSRDLYHSKHASETALDPQNYGSSNFDLIIHNQDISINEQNQIIHRFLKDKGILSL